MKCNHLLLIAVLMLTIKIASGQSLQTLQQQLQATKTPKERIYALDAVANYYTWTEGGYDAAKAYGRQMLSVAEKSGNKELLALAYVLNGIRLVEAVPSTEREKELRSFFAQAIHIARENKLPFYEASAHIGLSGLPFHQVLVDGDEMLQWGRRAVVLSGRLSNDSLQAMALIAVANGYRFKNDNITAFHHFSEALQLAESVNDPYLLAYCYRAFGRFYLDLGNQDKALQYFSKVEQVFKKKKRLNYRDLHWLYMTQWNTTWAWSGKKDVEKARESVHQCIALSKVYHLPSSYRYAPLNQLLSLYISEKQYAEAKVFLQQHPYIDTFYKNQDYESQILKRRALIYQHTGRPDSANYFYLQAIAAVPKSIPVWSPGLHRDYGYFLMAQGRLQEAIQQFQIAKTRSEEFKNISSLVDAYRDLDSAYHKAGDVRTAYHYNKIYQRYKDSLNQLSKEKELAVLEVESEGKRIEQAQQVKLAQARLKTYGLMGGFTALLAVAGTLYRNNRQKQKANELLRQQKQKIEEALGELKLTQEQLIQQEKVASLGQLTAGIAHEIQNPLNFVNNFSEINKELIEELNSEQRKEQRDFQNENDLLGVIKSNTEKIAYHGKRAEAIVKNMLEHSRAGKGEKQLTDINALTNEYLRLAYHGMRAKDKTFNVNLETYFDPAVGRLHITPQDMGRVLLNMFNNAFYAVNEKKKAVQNGYEPIVSVSTKALVNKVEITVRDNGTGIPKTVLDKIYQPFFTTKPTGKGTGLGLSLSYDIITKGHGGTIKADTREGEYAEFVVQLPA